MADSSRAAARARVLRLLLLPALLGACDPARDVVVATHDGGAIAIDAAIAPPDAATAHDGSGEAPCGEACRPVALALGGGFSCALGADGSIRCWGRGQEGELGDGARRHRPGCRRDEDCAAAPVRVAFEERAVALDASGGPGACLVDEHGAAHCWGLDPFYSPAAADVRLAPEPLELGGARVSSVAQGVWLLCVITADEGAVRCQGRNDLGQLGQGAFGPPARELVNVLRADGAALGSAHEVGLAGAREVRVAIGGRFACAVTDESVWCWGVGDRGELGSSEGERVACGDGLTRRSCTTRAVRVDGIDGASVAQLGLGTSHACALLAGGEVRCWGDGAMGALGRGDRRLGLSPAPVPGVGAATQLAVGAEHTCVLREGGTIACWGANGSGQLGDGVGDHPGPVCEARRTAFDCSESPVDVVAIDDAIELAAGAAHTCAIRAGGEVVCWGDGATMQLGDGSRAPSLRPVVVRGL